MKNDVQVHEDEKDKVEKSVLKTEFEMSMVEELTYFLGLKIKQMDDGIFISQSIVCEESCKDVWSSKCTTQKDNHWNTH